MDATAIKAFVNSDGSLTEFAFDGTKGTVSYYEEDKLTNRINYEKRTVIYDSNEASQVSEYGKKITIVPNVGVKVLGNPAKTETEKNKGINLTYILIFGGALALGANLIAVRGFRKGKN